jgi:hypothetical protein
MGAGVGLKVRTNADDVFAKVEGFLATCRNVAAPRALNKLRDQAWTAGKRKIADVYKLKVSDVDKYATLKTARIGDLEATITVKGKGFPLYVFQPRQTKKGVSVLIKGKRIVIPHTFIATLRSGRVGVFARGSYGGKYARRTSNKGRFDSAGESFGRFQFGKNRLPISELYTFAPPDTLRNQQVEDAMSARVAEQASAVFAKEARFAAQSGSK